MDGWSISSLNKTIHIVRVVPVWNELSISNDFKSSILNVDFPDYLVSF